MVLQGSDRLRLDKWLWAARFYKTRSQATQAIDGGHVHLNGDRIKPSYMLKLGDLLRIRTQHGEFEVYVRALADKRGPAEVAQTLYEETPESAARRMVEAEQRALAPQFDHPQSRGRPTKKWRRQLHLFDRKNETI